MQQRHHDVGALGAQFGHVLGGRFDRALGGELALQVALVPVHDAGRSKADHTNLDGRLDLATIGRLAGERALHNGVGLHQRLLGLGAVHVGQHHGEARACALLAGIHTVHLQAAAQHLVQKRQAVVELVVAQRARIKAQRAHGLVHGQLLRAGNGLDHRLVVGQRRALDGVAVVHQQRVGKLLARGAHQRGRALKAIALVLGQLEVIVAAHVEVQIRGLQNGQRGRGARGHASIRATTARQRRTQCSRSGTSQRTARCQRHASLVVPIVHGFHPFFRKPRSLDGGFDRGVTVGRLRSVGVRARLQGYGGGAGVTCGRRSTAWKGCAWGKWLEFGACWG